MKYWYAGVAVLVLAAAAGLLLCRRKPASTDEIDGGVRHRVDTDAPKEIHSTQITFFKCKFSSLDRPMDDTPVAGQIFTLTATEDSCCFQVRTRDNETVSQTFIPDAEFFVHLQQIVSQYGFAQYNGQYYKVSGLPPDFGIELEVRYASGESIQTSDNQSCFLSNEAMEALVTLFQQKSF